MHPRHALYRINILRGKDQTLWETTSDALETEVAIRILIRDEMRDYKTPKHMKGTESESCSVVSDSLQPHGLYSPWNSPGQDTGVGSLSFLQGIFSTQGSNPGLPHCRWILYQLSHQGSPSKAQSGLESLRERTLSRPSTGGGVFIISLCVYVCAPVCLCVNKYVYVYICVYVPIYVCVCVCLDIG